MSVPRIFQFFRSYFDPQRDTKVLNANFEALEVLLNGGLQGSNIADDTITDDNLAPGAVGDTELDNTSPTQPSSVSATTGIKSDTGLAFIDLTWAQSGTVEVKEWEVRWRRQGETLYEYTRVGTQSIRIEGLFPNTTYEVGVQAVSRTDIQSGYAVADQVILTASDTVAPGQVSGLSIGAGFRTVTASWSDINIQDLMHYEVQLDTASTFNTGNLVTKVTNGTVVTFGNLVTGTTYYVRVRAVDLSSNVGTYSETVSDTTAQTQTPDYASLSVTTAVIANLAVSNAKIANLAVDSAKIADLAVGSAKIADLAVTTAKINTLAVTNAKINDLTVTKLTAGTLSAQVLLSGNIRTADSGARVVIDASGVKLYDSGNNVKVNLDTATGSASFTGTITASTITGGLFRTAASGARVELSSTNLREVRIYSSNGTDFGYLRSDETNGLQLVGPGGTSANLLIGATTGRTIITRPVTNPPAGGLRGLLYNIGSSSLLDVQFQMFIVDRTTTPSAYNNSWFTDFSVTWPVAMVAEPNMASAEHQGNSATKNIMGGTQIVLSGASATSGNCRFWCPEGDNGRRRSSTMLVANA